MSVSEGIESEIFTSNIFASALLRSIVISHRKHPGLSEEKSGALQVIASVATKILQMI